MAAGASRHDLWILSLSSSPLPRRHRTVARLAHGL